MRKWYAAGLVIAAGLGAVVLAQWPELHRYLKMERM
jgi:hypothetical protein